MSSGESGVELEHHKQQDLCTTRAPYRQGRKLTAIKVYTINNESIHLLIFGVPGINLQRELKTLCRKFGRVTTVAAAPEHKTETFTECYRVSYQRIQSARIAKRRLDTKNFYGGSLHVCYAPEYETLEETREKFNQRRNDYVRGLEIYKTESSIDVEKKTKINETFNDFPPEKTLESRMVTVRKNGKLDGFGAVFGEMYKGKGKGVVLKKVTVESDVCNGKVFDESSCSQMLFDDANLAGCSKNILGDLDHDFQSNIKHSCVDVNSIGKGRLDGSRGSPCGVIGPHMEMDDAKRIVNDVEYVFKRKKRKNNEDLKRAIDRMKEGINKLKKRGAKDDFVDFDGNEGEKNVAFGKVSICDTAVEQPKILKAPNKSVNLIHFNIKK